MDNRLESNDLVLIYAEDSTFDGRSVSCDAKVTIGDPFCVFTWTMRKLLLKMLYNFGSGTDG